MTTTDFEARLEIGLTELAACIDVGEPAPARVLELADHRSRRPVTALRLGVAAAAAVALVVAALALRPDDVEVQVRDDTVHDVGAVADFPEGSATYVPALRLFVTNPEDGHLLALSQASSRNGCRVLGPAQIADAGLDLAAEVAFHDPCHGELWDLAGRHVGGPGVRGLVRYALTVTDGRVLVDTSLAQAGPWRDGTPARTIDAIGPRDDLAAAWADAFVSRAPSDTSGFALNLRPLAAGRRADGAVVVDVASDAFDGELLVGSADVVPSAITGDSFVRTITTDAGDVQLTGPPGDVAVFAELLLPGGDRLRLSLLGGPRELVSELPSDDELALLVASLVAAGPAS